MTAGGRAGRGRVLVGTSGWSYDTWHGDFYPEELRRADELAYLAERVTSTEVNASFYRLQRPSSYRAWAEQTPPEHVFAIKGSRYITHVKRMRDAGTALANLLASGVFELGPKLAVMLWQLPRTVRFDAEAVGEFLALLPRDRDAAEALAKGHDDRVPADRVVLDAGRTPERWRHALEPRHPSFASEEAQLLLAEHGVATVHSDSPRRWPAFDQDTADFRYVRLHGHSELYASRYSDAALDAWAQRCAGWLDAGQDVHVYFDNDARGHAPHDAVRLLDRLRDR